MIDSSKFEKMFHPSWWPSIKLWLESDNANQVYSFLKDRGRQGVRILPESDKTFRAFKLCSKDDLRAVIVGLSPYHTLGRDQFPSADGLAFSNGLTKSISPSLEKFYDAIDKDYGKKVKRDLDLSYLAEQGVLLMNYSLTTELGKATIHADKDLWQTFNKHLYQNVLGSHCGIPILLCGKQAQKLDRYLFEMCHEIKKVEHPAAAARDGRTWKHESAFKWINNVIERNFGIYSTIEWDNESYSTTPF